MGHRKKILTTQPLLLTIPDVAVHLGVCRQTVYNLIYHENLPSIKVRGMRRVSLDSLQKWIAEREQALA
jgi:excisionase family DNA binding protein